MIIGPMWATVDNSLPLDPASAYAAPTALPPVNTLPADPEEAYGSATSTPSGYPEPQAVDQQGMLSQGGTPEQLMSLASGIGAGELGGKIVSGIGGKVASLFEVPESLKSAGITANTLEHMAPGSQNPADYVKAVEKQFSDKGVLATTAKETWDKMFPEAQKVGQTIKNTLQQLKAESANISDRFGGILDPTVVDAQPVLQPLADQATKLQGGVYSGTQATAKPFQQAYEGLMNMAKSHGGKLSLENIEPVLKETGAMMDQGEESRSLYGPVYGRLADVRDSMVNTIAQQSPNKELAQILLKNNADYSTYMRVLPSVEKAAFKEAIKEGVSAYQKYGGPLITKGIATYAIGKEIASGIDKFLGGSH